MKMSAITVSMLGMTAGVQAHVAELPAAQHAAEHAWLSLALIPLLAVLLPLLRRRR